MGLFRPYDVWMQIEHLFLESFGIYKSRRLEFGDGLQVIYGPNESGKTTLLAALRQTLFGIPSQSAYAIDGSPSTQARVRLADGRRISLIRKKTRGSGLSGEFDASREPLTPEVWDRCLTGATAGLFENLFAISLRELTAGEDSLKSAGLTEALFGMAIGGMSKFRELDEQLQSQSDELFSKSGNAKKPRVNSLSREILAAEREYQAARFSPRDYTGLQEQIEEQEARAQKLREEWDACQKQVRQLERIEAALPAWREAERFRTEMVLLGQVASVPIAVIGELKTLCGKQAELQSELERIQGRLALPMGETLLPGADLLPQEQEIRSLADQVARVSEALVEQESLSAALETLEQRVANELSAIQPGWSTVDLHRVTSSLAQREIAQQLSEEAARSQQARSLLKSRRKELEEHRVRIDLELQALPETDSLPGVRDLLERAGLYRVECQRFREVAPALNQLIRQTQKLEEQLAGVAGVSADELGQFAVPLSATVERHAVRFDSVTRELEQIHSRVGDAEHRVSEAQDSLARFDRDHEICDRDQLFELRQAREMGWSLIARKYIEGESDLKAIESWTTGQPDQLVPLYRERILAADSLADQLLSNAERIAERQQLVHQVERCQAAWTERLMDRDRIAGVLGQCEREWCLEWPPAPFRTRTPREMGEWLKLRSQWLDCLKSCEQQRAEQTRRTELIEQFEAELLRPGLDISSSTSRDRIVREALLEMTEQERMLTSAQLTRERLQQDQRTFSARLEAIELEQLELAQVLAEIETRKSVFLSQLGFPSDWEMAVANRVVTRLLEVQLLDQELTHVQQRLQQVQQQILAFSERSQSLFARVGVSWSGPVPACDQIIGWRLELDERGRLELEQTRLMSERVASEKLIQRVQEQSRDGDQRIKTLRLGLPGLAGIELSALFAEADHAETLRSETRDLDHQWQAYADADPKFGELLRASSLDEVRNDRQRLTRLMREQEEERTRALTNAGTVRLQLQSREVETRALELGQTLEGLRAQLGDAIDQWAPLALARHLMEASRVRFEKTQQPQLLVEAGRIFEQLTEGEYVQLTRSVGQVTELLAIPKVGAAKAPSEMSTGTREQLYLAIRLAYLQQYSQRAEPLPLVLDDVLVNFDEDRSRQTLRVLNEFSKSYQILFLTCHRRMVELVQSIRPDLKPIELKSGSLDRVESLEKLTAVDSPSSKPKRASRKPTRDSSEPEHPQKPEHPVLFREVN